jgi:hypothetical protein
MMRSLLAPVVALLLTTAAPAADYYAPLDHVLDTYVREGNVYYRALESERRALDPFVHALAAPPEPVARMSDAARTAFWINAYNALVLRTVIDHYPIKGRAAEYPADSIRQIAGAFDKIAYDVAGERLTLDEIEARAIAAGGGRVVFALGRGAVGSGRLKSEAYRADRLDAQLESAVKEFVVRVACLKVDEGADTLTVSPLFSWRRDPIIATFQAGGGAWPGRSPIEQAIAALASPKLFPSERAYLAENRFQLKYGDFDWRLNDLTGGPPR